MDQLVLDLRYTLRTLRRNPTFTLAAVLTLALGIGATTSVFSAVDRILFRALPFAHADRIASVGLAAPMLPYDFMFGAQYREFRDSQQVFEAVTSWSGVHDCDLTEAEPVRLSCAAVESTFLETLGVHPVLGRSFRRDDDTPSAARTVLISHAL